MKFIFLFAIFLVITQEIDQAEYSQCLVDKCTDLRDQCGQQCALDVQAIYQKQHNIYCFTPQDDPTDERKVEYHVQCAQQVANKTSNEIVKNYFTCLVECSSHIISLAIIVLLLLY